MNIVLHIIWKDLRAVRGPLAMLAVGLAALEFDRYLGVFGARMWRNPAAFFLIVVLSGMAVALVAALVQEDNLVSTTAFWRTRPIVRGRLLVAKLLACGLVFVPAFSPLLMVSVADRNEPDILKQIGLAACVMIVTATVAALTSDLKQFLVGAVLAICAFGLMHVFSSDIAREIRIYRPWWGTNQFDAALMLTGVFCAVPLACQYFGVPRKFGIVLLLAAIVLGPLLSLV